MEKELGESDEGEGKGGGSNTPGAVRYFTRGGRCKGNPLCWKKTVRAHLLSGGREGGGGGRSERAFKLPSPLEKGGKMNRRRNPPFKSEEVGSTKPDILSQRPKGGGGRREESKSLEGEIGFLED